MTTNYKLSRNERRLNVRAFFDEISYVPPGGEKHFTVPLEQMFAIARGLGLTAHIPRSANFGTRTSPNQKRLLQAGANDIALYIAMMEEFGVTAPVFGSALGKGLLVVPAENQSRQYVPNDKYLEGDVRRVGELARRLGCTEVRLFTFNYPSGGKSADFVDQAIEMLGPVVAYLKQNFGLRCRAEIEVNLVGETATNLLKICQAIPGLGAVWDWGNVASRGDDLTGSFETLFPVVRHLHAKHYVGPKPNGGQVNEDHLRHYFPLHYKMDETGVRDTLLHLYREWDTFTAGLLADGATEAAIDIEGHLRGGGEFGGVSGENGLFIALMGLQTALERAGFQTDIPCVANLFEERSTAP